MQMLYGKQLENERLLIELNARLANLDNIPERVAALEITAAKGAWVERVAWAALTAGVVAIVNQIANIL